MKKAIKKTTGHVNTGINIQSGKHAAEYLTTLVRKKLGKKYPKVLQDGLGKQLEPALIPLAVSLLFGAAEESGINIPTGKNIQALAGYAVQATSGEAIAALIEHYMPEIADLAKTAGVLKAAGVFGKEDDKKPLSSHDLDFED